MKQLILFLSGVVVTLVLVYVVDAIRFHPITPLSNESASIQRPLSKYSILALSQRQSQTSPIVLEEIVATNDTFTSHKFSFTSEGKRVSGLVNIPKGTGPFPVIVQFRGYVDRERYTTGEGTKRSGEVYAANGFVTIAPDFLGYGDSDNPSNIALEERFQTYTTALDLLATLPTLPQIDPQKINLWGHSNGGHIALTILAITGTSYPTTLWAPVSKPFPYSILYFTDELVDGGKFIRGEVSRFEGIYGVDEYTFRSYLDRIQAPIQLHQGTADDAVPVAWSDEFSDSMKKKQKPIEYYRYPGADHNMLGSWSTVVERDLEFFRQNLK